MHKYIKTVFILSFILFFACGNKGIEGFVGEGITITAESPEEEGKKFDYDWRMISVPDGSLLTEMDLVLGKHSKKMTFTPDYPGDYQFEVIASKYGDEISNQSYSFSIIDDGRSQASIESPQEDEEEVLVTEENDSEEDDELSWLDATIEDDGDDEEEEETEIEEEIEVEKEEIPVSKPAPKLVKKVRKKAKPKTKIVTSIPADKTRFTIQVVSKSSLKAAQKTEAELIIAGYDAYIQKAVFTEKNETWYRVRIGSYNNRKSANAVSKAVSKNLGLETWVDFVRFDQ